MPEITVADSGSEVRTGGCLCGKVRFTVTGPVDDPHICACTHCSTRSGAPFQWWVGFPMDGLKWTGTDPNWFDTHPGKTARGFCGTCGSHLAARDHGNDMAIGILATALDHHTTDPALAPTNLSRLAEAAPWLTATGCPGSAAASTADPSQ
ncbi:GFA family protein [Streptomyces sp. NPDC059525]|uniref:GFA family protein n=1 Tax=Streptomyces sp. NPDC059525 TaxID=3346857 RepID=UPI0036A4C501